MMFIFYNLCLFEPIDFGLSLIWLYLTVNHAFHHEILRTRIIHNTFSLCLIACVPLLTFTSGHKDSL